MKKYLPTIIPLLLLAAAILRDVIKGLPLATIGWFILFDIGIILCKLPQRKRKTRVFLTRADERK